MMPDTISLTSCPASRLLRDIGPYRIAQDAPVQYIAKVPSTRALLTARTNNHSENGIKMIDAPSSQKASDATALSGTPALAARKPVSECVIGRHQPMT